MEQREQSKSLCSHTSQHIPRTFFTTSHPAFFARVHLPKHFFPATRRSFFFSSAPSRPIPGIGDSIANSRTGRPATLVKTRLNRVFRTRRLCTPPPLASTRREAGCKRRKAKESNLSPFDCSAFFQVCTHSIKTRTRCSSRQAHRTPRQPSSAGLRFCQSHLDLRPDRPAVLVHRVSSVLSTLYVYLFYISAPPLCTDAPADVCPLFLRLHLIIDFH